LIYIKEAHASDEWHIPTNEFEGVCYRQPTTLAERLRVARDFVEREALEWPLVVDTMADEALEAFAGWPERIYIVDSDGRIALKGGLGPFGYDPDDIDVWMRAQAPEVVAATIASAE